MARIRTTVVLVFLLAATLPLDSEAAYCIKKGERFGITYYDCFPDRSPLLPSLISISRPPAPAPSLPRDRFMYEELARAAARRYGVSHRLVLAVITVESGWNASAVSKKGAEGLMQLMPETARGLGVRNAFDPAENIDGGVRHLGDLLNHFGGNVRLALAAYNAGADAVRKYGGVPPYPETIRYVRLVMRQYRTPS